MNFVEIDGTFYNLGQLVYMRDRNIADQTQKKWDTEATLFELTLQFSSGVHVSCVGDEATRIKQLILATQGSTT